MKILGISAHYHDSAAALVVDGVPVCAVQEERLSRHKNDATFPLGAIEWCLRSRRSRSRRSRRRRLLRAEHAEVRPDPDQRAADVSAILAVLSARHQELARRKGVGARASSRRTSACRDRRSCSPGTTTRTRPPRFLTAPTRRAAILTADGVGEWATLTVGHGERRAGGARPHHAAARDQISALARHAVFDVHGLSRLRRERGRIQSDGACRLRASDDGRRRCAS